MPVGIASFQPERLVQARNLRQLTTITALSELSGISKESISRYESGKGKPTEDRLDVLARTLNLPKLFFLTPMPVLATAPMLFRSMSAAVKAERGRARELLSLALEAGNYMNDVLELPAYSLPKVNERGRIRDLPTTFIEEAAQETRRAIGFPTGPMPNLVTLAERSGVLVARTRLADRELDGVSQWSPVLPGILLNSTKSPARSRFDLAHEIGHLVLHSNVVPDVLDSKEAFKTLETQAHRFASALLLPGDEFAADLWSVSLDDFVLLKPKWQVSVQAMLRRVLDLGIIGEEDHLRMIKQISGRKWRTKEPLEDVVEEERPTLLRSCLEVIEGAASNVLYDLQRSLPFLPILEDLAGYRIGHSGPNTIVSLAEYRSSR